MLQSQLFWFNKPSNFIVLFQLNNPLTKTFGCSRGLFDSTRLKVRVIKEIFDNLLDYMLGNVILVKTFQSRYKVAFIHEFSRCEPPIVFQLFRVVLLGRAFNLTLAHNAYSMKHKFDGCWRISQSFHFVDILGFDSV